MLGARPADLLPDPTDDGGGCLGGGQDVARVDDAPATEEEEGRQVAVFVDDLAGRCC